MKIFKPENLALLALFAAGTVSAHESANCDLRGSFTITKGIPTTDTPTFLSGQRISILEIPQGGSTSSKWSIFEYVQDFRDTMNAELVRIPLCHDAMLTTSATNELELSCDYYYNDNPDYSGKTSGRYDINSDMKNFKLEITLVKADPDDEQGCISALMDGTPPRHTQTQAEDLCGSRSDYHCILAWKITDNRVQYANQGGGAGSGGGSGH